MNQLVNNWMYGETSPKLGGRFDTAIYQQGCERLENFLPMKQGGITRRPPLKHIAECYRSRLIPLAISNGNSYLLELTAERISIWEASGDSLAKSTIIYNAVEQDYAPTDYTLTDIWEVQYAQYYNRLYLAHRDHQPVQITYDGLAFSIGVIDLITDVDSDFGSGPTHYPGVVGVCQNRLWFASTHANPYTMWASRPHETYGSHYNFTTVDIADSEVEVMKPPAEWPKTTDENGNEIYDMSDPDAYIEIQTKSEEVITARCAMELELASGRNDNITWINGMNNIIVGTQASEWMMPFSINPTQQSASMQSVYGSEPIQAVGLNNGVFYLQNGFRLREYTATAQGAGSYDHSFTADHMLKAGVRQMIPVKHPVPMIMMVLTDGTLVVFVYDQMYQIQAWARWNTQGNIISVSTMDNADGSQDIYAVVERDGVFYMEKFDFTEEVNFFDRYGEAVNGTLTYPSKMVGNRFDFVGQSGVSIGRPKKVKEVWVRCLNSGRLKTGVDEKYMQASREAVGSEDYRILVSGGSRREMQVIIESVEGDPLTLLAMTYDVEVA